MALSHILQYHSAPKLALRNGRLQLRFVHRHQSTGNLKLKIHGMADPKPNTDTSKDTTMTGNDVPYYPGLDFALLARTPSPGPPTVGRSIENMPDFKVFAALGKHPIAQQ